MACDLTKKSAQFITDIFDKISKRDMDERSQREDVRKLYLETVLDPSPLFTCTTVAKEDGFPLETSDEMSRETRGDRMSEGPPKGDARARFGGFNQGTSPRGDEIEAYHQPRSSDSDLSRSSDSHASRSVGPHPFRPRRRIGDTKSHLESESGTKNRGNRVNGVAAGHREEIVGNLKGLEKGMEKQNSIVKLLIDLLEKKNKEKNNEINK